MKVVKESYESSMEVAAKQYPCLPPKHRTTSKCRAVFSGGLCAKVRQKGRLQSFSTFR